MRIGLLLKGGAMRGLYTAGVLDVLMANNLVIDDIIGVSAGALFGMNYKSKQIGRVLRYNKKYVSNKDFMGFHSLITTGNIMNKDFCFNKLVNELDPVDFETYKNSKENFYAVVTNIESGKAEYIKILKCGRCKMSKASKKVIKIVLVIVCLLLTVLGGIAIYFVSTPLPVV